MMTLSTVGVLSIIFYMCQLKIYPREKAAVEE